MQSRLASLIESLTNVLVGYTLSVTLQMGLLHAIGEPISWKASNIVGAVMTVASILRSYSLRRLFNHIAHRRDRNAAGN